MFDNLLDTCVNAGVVRVQDDVRMAGGLIRRVDAGKLWEVAASGTFVETFRVAFFANVERCVDKNLEERVGADYLPCIFSMRCIR